MDWAFLEDWGGATLRSLGSIPYGDHRSYAALDGSQTGRDLGRLRVPIPFLSSRLATASPAAWKSPPRSSADPRAANGSKPTNAPPATARR